MASKTVKINDQLSLVIYEGTSQVRIIDNETNKAYVLKSDSIVNNDLNTDDFLGAFPAGTVRGHLVPETDNEFDLGSPSYKFKDLYLSEGTLYIGDVALSADGNILKINDLDLAQAVGAEITTVDFNNLINKPTIPTAVSQLTNDSGFINSSNLTWISISGKPTFATVATSGSYGDLSNTPTLSTVATSGSYADLSNTPTFATVATSGSYTDLTNRPSLSNVATSGSYTDLTNRPSFATVATSGSYTDLSNRPTIPTSILNLGITDGTSGQVLTTNGAGVFTFQDAGDQIGNFTLSSSTIDTDDSSAISIIPAVNILSDLTVQNDLTVSNDVTVTGSVVAGSFSTLGEGSPELESDTDITLTAGTRVIISSSPLKMASFTTAERDALISQNGDVIYNTTSNKFQGYANGTWVDLH